MPVYVYLCESCKADFEAFASIQKKESGWKPVCPKCGSAQTRQIFKSIRVGTLAGGRSAEGGSCCSPRRR